MEPVHENFKKLKREMEDCDRDLFLLQTMSFFGCFSSKDHGRTCGILDPSDAFQPSF